MIPSDLLSALREKDPELYERITKLAVGEYESFSDEGFYEKTTVSYEELFDDAKEAWLQHCLQEAIRARGWSYTLDCVPNGPNKCGACVIFGRQFHNRRIRNGDTEAAALLRAYLAALEAA